MTPKPNTPNSSHDPKPEDRNSEIWVILYILLVSALLIVGDSILRFHPMAGRICLILGAGCLLIPLMIATIQAYQDRN